MATSVPICATCNAEMRCERNGVMVAPEGMTKEYPDMVRSSDRYLCTGCGARVLVGFGAPMPVETMRLRIETETRTGPAIGHTYRAEGGGAHVPDSFFHVWQQSGDEAVSAARVDAAAVRHVSMQGAGYGVSEGQRGGFLGHGPDVERKFDEIRREARTARKARDADGTGYGD